MKMQFLELKKEFHHFEVGSYFADLFFSQKFSKGIRNREKFSVGTNDEWSSRSLKRFVFFIKHLDLIYNQEIQSHALSEEEYSDESRGPNVYSQPDRPVSTYEKEREVLLKYLA